jgi:hypothetical protein
MSDETVIIPTWEQSDEVGHPRCKHCGRRLNEHWITQQILARVGVDVDYPCPSILDPDADW